MSIRELALRYSVFVTGLFIMALGIGMGVHADLGISPISCPPYVMSLGAPRFTLGQYTILLHILLILLQIVLLRRQFERIQLLQLAVAFAFGFFCDLGVRITAPLTPATYGGQLALMLSSCLVQAIGISLEISAGALLLAGEGAMLAIARVTRIPFERVKVAFDVALVAIGMLLAWLLFGDLTGIREGTFVSAVLIGLIIGRIHPRVSALAERWIAPGIRH